MGKDKSPSLVYTSLMKALDLAAQAKLSKVIMTPIDLVSLGFSQTKATELIVQVIFDYCNDSSKIQFDEILMPIQTLSMAEKADKSFLKLLNQPGKSLFTYQPPVPPVSQRAQRTDKSVTDSQKLIQDLNRSEGFSDLDYDIDPIEIQKLQRKDSYFSLIIDYLQNDNLPSEEKIAKKIRKESQNFELISGILYHFWLLPRASYTEQRARFRLCVPPELRHRIMYVYHDAPISAHRSAEKMYLSMKLNYYWKGMFADIDNWTKSCIRCSKAKPMPKHRRAQLQPIMEHKPMGMVNCELVGGMQENPQKYRYILILVD